MHPKRSKDKGVKKRIRKNRDERVMAEWFNFLADGANKVDRLKRRMTLGRP